VDTDESSIDDITISAKGEKVVHVVADQWDEEGQSFCCTARGVTEKSIDHLSWDIKLGEDADMCMIRAKFNDGELQVTGGSIRTVLEIVLIA